MIRLGLERISRLLKDVPLSWKAIHVAGTNGKGSVSTYISSMLRAGDLHTGRFNSPHLIDRWDGISIDERPVSKYLFQRVEDKVRRRNERETIDASEFEILTATAFEVFNEQNVQVAVVECGMGGLLDATNVLEEPVATVITSISMDHQDWLGNELRSIAKQKAGIIKPGCVCLVDGSNDPEVLDEITQAATRCGAPLEVVSPQHIPAEVLDGGEVFMDALSRQNRALAFGAVRQAVPYISNLVGFKHEAAGSKADDIALNLAPAMRTALLLGRYQHLSLAKITRRQAPVLLDGAHNPEAWSRLASHVIRTLRAGKTDTPVTWVLALSKKSVSPVEMLTCLTQPGDCVVAVEFGHVQGMPWVRPVAAEDFKACEADRRIESYKGDLKSALQRACIVADEGPLVIAGSLYLVGDVLRLLRGIEDA